MLVFAVYIISTDGRPLLIERFTKDEEMPSDVLLCGLLATIQLLSEELTGEPGSAEKFQLKGYIFHLKSFSNKFQVVVASNFDESPDDLLENLGLRFYKKYSQELENWKGDQTKFSDFGGTIIEQLKGKYKIDISRSLDPKKRLDTMNILSLPKSIQDTALIVVMLEHATVSEMEKFLKKKPAQIEKHLKALQQDGYIGVELMEDEIYYYIISN